MPIDNRQILKDIADERQRQDYLKSIGRFKYTLADDGLSDAIKLACIMEEVGEIARNILASAGKMTDGDPTPAAQYKELMQIAALCVAWMEAL